jgi:RNA recognition motif-containing protein
LLLLAEFEQHGAAKAEIMMDKMTNRSRGFGFVWFNSRAGMEDAIRDKHNAEIDGRRISVKEAIPQEQIPPGELLQSCTSRHLHIHAPVICVT